MEIKEFMMLISRNFVYGKSMSIQSYDKIYRETKKSLWIKKLKTFEPLGLNIKLDRH